MRRMHAVGLSALALAVAAGAAHAQCGAPLDKMWVNEPEAYDALGEALSMSSTYAGPSVLAGMHLDTTPGGFAAGAVYTFIRVDNQWGQVSRFYPADGQMLDFFGWSVSQTDPIAAVGAPGVGNARGAAYFYARAGSTWHQKGKVLGQADGDDFGWAVATDGEWAIVGAPRADLASGSTTDQNAGAAYFYKRDPDYGTWSGGQKVFLPSGQRAAEDRYGSAVDISGEWAIVGVPYHDHFVLNEGWKNDSGSAVLLRRNTLPALWLQSVVLSHPEPQAGDHFGAKVLIDGDYAVVSAPDRTVNGHAGAGAVYVFRNTGTEWVQDGTLLPVASYDNARFGAAIDISGTRIVVGAPGEKRAYLFRRIGPGLWAQDVRLSDPDGPDAFGAAVAIHNSDVVVGDPGDDLTGIENAGALHAWRIIGVHPDSCEGAMPASAGVYTGCTENATTDGATNCGGVTGPDVWYRYTAPATGTVLIDTEGSGFNTVLSVHSGCPATSANTLACNDDFGIFTTDSRVGLYVVQGQTYLIRVAGKSLARGAYTLRIGEVSASCYANCDNSTTPPILNVNDFICFQARFAAGSPLANCDGSTTPPILNVNDFICFQSRFASGCE